MSREYRLDFDTDIQIMLGQISEKLSEKGKVVEWSLCSRNEYYVIEQGYDTVYTFMSKRDVWDALNVTIRALEQL